MNIDVSEETAPHPPYLPNVSKPYSFTTPHGVTFEKTVILTEVNQAVWRLHYAGIDE
jgi:hypothetical protein